MRKPPLESFLLVPQIDPADAEDRWHHVEVLLPLLHTRGNRTASDNVPVWCLKVNAVYGGQLVVDGRDIYWYTRSIGSNLVDIQHHIRHVTHWRPIPDPPPVRPRSRRK
jgi:hypothetical protein